MIIDLRSDTITKPTKGMLQAMQSAQVGDDVFGEDPTVKSLESKLATMFGMENGLFCPSGTMCNQIAIRILTQPQDELICDELSHIHLYEGGGIAYNSMVSTQLVKGDRGRISADLVLQNIKADDIHFPSTRLVTLENTVNKGGGSIYRLSEIASIAEVCKANQLSMHLDGARIFNALTASGDTAKDYGQYFDTISVCLSKGLGAPVGSVLLSSQSNIRKARRVRKVLGGAMRQSGYLAAAGIYALDHHVERLTQDHHHASQLANILSDLPWIESVLPAETNIVIFNLLDSLNKENVIERLSNENIRVVPFGPSSIRMVTHLEITDSMIDRVETVLRKLKF
ncbi:MAG: threonine aldolase family protein [Cyclobacteriaceae bacterium]